MGLFNRKSSTKTENIDPHKIQHDFYVDWFNVKYNNLFSSKYLEGLKYVKDLDISPDKMTEISNFTMNSDIDSAIAITDLHLATIVSMQAAYITLGHKVLESPTLLLDEEFETFYHDTLPHVIEALQLLDQYGDEHEYPLMRVNAVLRSVKYAPNFTIEAGDVAKQQSVEILDLSFYDRYDTLRLEVYTPMIKLIKKFHHQTDELDFKKSFAIIDDLLNVAHKPGKDNENV